MQGFIILDHYGARFDEFKAEMQKRIEMHFVDSLRTIGIAELLGFDECLPIERSLPDLPHRPLMLRPVCEQLEHVVAHAWPDPVDPFELSRGGVVDREQAKVLVCHLDERVRCFDQLGHESSLRERLGHASLERFVEILQAQLRPLARSDIHGGADDSLTSIVIEDAAPLRRHPARQPVFLANRAEFDVAYGTPFGVHRGSERPGHPIAIVRMHPVVELIHGDFRFG